MTKVITYGTYDLLHYGHVRLLERAKALGDYLIVGVTADDFDKTRGKINVRQQLGTRIEAVKSTGLADEVIVEEYEGQKIDDIRRYGIDIFTIGSDWTGTFDYLKEYCDVVYLERTEGVSSSEIRNRNRSVLFGLIGDSGYLERVRRESGYVNGIQLSGLCTECTDNLSDEERRLPLVTDDFQKILDVSDAVFIHSHPSQHYSQIRQALNNGVHVLCESPAAMSRKQCAELYDLAQQQKCILVDGLRTAYATAFCRLLLLIKAGKIGRILSVDAVCTSLRDYSQYTKEQLMKKWNSITAWGPTALLPVFQILGTDYRSLSITSSFLDEEIGFDVFTKLEFVYSGAVASVKVGNGVKSEGQLIISGTKGYIYVPAPWWKTDYFEVRYENPAENQRYFYQLEGEGIRNELADFAKVIEESSRSMYISREISEAIAGVMEKFRHRDNMHVI